MNRSKHNIISGFTMLDLLIIITIIMILTTVVLASTTRSLAQARDAKRIANLYDFQKALEGYYLEHGEYPNPSSDFYSATTSLHDLRNLSGPQCKANTACYWLNGLDPEGLDTDPLNQEVNNLLLQRTLVKLSPNRYKGTCFKDANNPNEGERCALVLLKPGGPIPVPTPTQYPSPDAKLVDPDISFNPHYYYYGTKQCEESGKYESYILVAWLEIEDNQTLKKNNCVPNPFAFNPLEYLRNDGCLTINGQTTVKYDHIIAENALILTPLSHNR
jgi:type II secretory pathway pseudopilin PulG